MLRGIELKRCIPYILHRNVINGFNASHVSSVQKSAEKNRLQAFFNPKLSVGKTEYFWEKAPNNVGM